MSLMDGLPGVGQPPGCLGLLTFPTTAPRGSVEAGGVVGIVGHAPSTTLDTGYGHGHSRAGSRDPVIGDHSAVASTDTHQ